MHLISLSGKRIIGSGSYNIDVWINPASVSEIIENTGGEPACILIMHNGSKYDINMSGKRLAQMLEDYKNE